MLATFSTYVVYNNQTLIELSKTSVMHCTVTTVAIDCLILAGSWCWRSYSQSKLELNSKKVELEWCKKKIRLFISCFFAHKAKLQLLKFEFCQIKLR